MERSRYRAQRKFGRITIPRIEDLDSGRPHIADISDYEIEVMREAHRDDPTVLDDAAFASGIHGENIGAMMALVDRAVVLNPWKMASAWRWAGPHERPNPL